MIKTPAVLLMISMVAATLSACLPLTPMPSNQVSEAYIQTAVASTLAAERALAAGEALSYTPTPEGTPAGEGTPEGEEVEGTQETEGGEPAPENPWMLQSWCVDHPTGCVYYGLNNRTDSWLQIELKETDTGVTGFFTVRAKTSAEINLIPGLYNVKYTWWCDGEAFSKSEVKGIGSRIDLFKCPRGN